ncbi:hypothetical protein BJX62DRAFT_194971 [Aspergillus germanicus]
MVLLFQADPGTQPKYLRRCGSPFRIPPAVLSFSSTPNSVLFASLSLRPFYLIELLILFNNILRA